MCDIYGFALAYPFGHAVTEELTTPPGRSVAVGSTA